MARAAAKRRQPVRHHEDRRRRHKDSGGQRFEDTLFFNRLRKRAKWVFVFLTLAFALGFVLFGVGSSNVSGLSDIFNGIRGGGGGTSLSKAQKATQKDPKNAQAWHDLAVAYDQKGDTEDAITAWTTYATLRPKDVDSLTQLASDYEQQFSTETQKAAAAQAGAQTAQGSTFGPPATSPLGRALASVPDPITQAASTAANQRFNDALSARQATAGKLVDVYQRIAILHRPPEPADQLLLAQAAQNAGNTQVAVTAYKKFVQLAPDDPNAAYARQQIKALSPQSQG
jgi:tetratricopeptide (TPR) repeat protein